MDEIFREKIESLVPSFDELLSMQPIRGLGFPRADTPDDKPLRGIYLFTEGKNHLYVGRSNDIVGRYYAHRRESSGDGVAVFAFRLACMSSNRTGISYKAGHQDTRAMKMKDPDFFRHFSIAKARIREMDFRYVLESDPVKQALLEVYCAVALKTPHNTFDNH